jgi:hypothetical protein
MITDRDIQTVKSKIEPILGQKAWGVSLGEGSFLTLNFGCKILSKNKDSDINGEWYLWIYYCAWRLEKNNQVLAASEDSRSKLEAAIRHLEGLTIQSIDILKPAWDTIISFEKNIVLRLFPIYSEEYEHWILFMPDDYVLTIGSGTDWSCVQEMN